MASWVKNFIVLFVLAVWGTIMFYWAVVSHQKPDAFTWGIPGAIYLALNPQLPGRPKEDRPAEGKP